MFLSLYLTPPTVASPPLPARELRTMISQLRLDNTELRHRLRQGGISSNTTTQGGSSATAALNTEWATANAKLRKQVDGLKKELHEASLSYDRLRIESAKEIARWKSKIGSPGLKVGSVGAEHLSQFRETGGSSSSNSPSKSTFPGPDSGHTTAALVDDLRQRLAAVQKELRMERAGRSAAHPTGSGSGSGSGRGWVSSGRNGTPSSGSGGGWNNNTNTNSSRYSASTNARRSTSADLARRSSSSGRFGTPSGGGGGGGGWTSSSARGTSSSGATGARARSSSPIVARAGSAGRSGGHADTTATASSSTNNSRSYYSRSREASPPVRLRSGSPVTGAAAPSSSLGGRFNPTAYQQERALREQVARSGRAWGAGASSSFASPRSENRSIHSGDGGGSGGRYRYQSPSAGESGYASATSQVYVSSVCYCCCS
jgi:hypothetical protein